MSKKSDFKLSPMRNYTPPKLPTLAEAGAATPLKAIPSRWKKNAAVMACLGFVGAFALTGCYDELGYGELRSHNGGAPEAPFYIAQTTETETGRYHHGGDGAAPFYVAHQTEEEILAQAQAHIEEANIDLRAHWGGSGSGPFYIAHITEEEVRGYIHARLTAAGLNVNYSPPDYAIFGPDVPRPGMLGEMGIDFFDFTNRVSVIQISWEDSTMPFSPSGQELADIVLGEFSRKVDDMTFGVVINPGRMVCDGRFMDAMFNADAEEPEEVTPEEIEGVRYYLIRDLATQLDRFIAQLQAEGIV